MAFLDDFGRSSDNSGRLFLAGEPLCDIKNPCNRICAMVANMRPAAGEAERSQVFFGA